MAHNSRRKPGTAYRFIHSNARLAQCIVIVPQAPHGSAVNRPKSLTPYRFALAKRSVCSFYPLFLPHPILMHQTQGVCNLRLILEPNCGSLFSAITSSLNGTIFFQRVSDKNKQLLLAITQSLWLSACALSKLYTILSPWRVVIVNSVPLLL